VNNAGTYEFAPLESITPEHIQKHLNLNVTGLLLTTKEAVKLMGPDGGSIVNIGSIVGSMLAPQAARLQCKQGRSKCNHGFSIAGAWPAKNPCELAQSRRRGY
jgi:NAD(P)-dependent dehydrogenase (short-subunit alcohol dehydrogenase family)